MVSRAAGMAPTRFAQRISTLKVALKERALPTGQIFPATSVVGPAACSDFTQVGATIRKVTEQASLIEAVVAGRDLTNVVDAACPFGGTSVAKSATGRAEEAVVQIRAIDPILIVGAYTVGVATGTARALDRGTELSHDTYSTGQAIAVEGARDSRVVAAPAAVVVIDARLTGHLAYEFASRQVASVDASIAFADDAR